MSMAESPLSSRLFTGAAVVMGVTSCGKTTVGEALAASLGVMFIEGDTLHGTANIDKMSRGIALTDEDRWPWLARVGDALQNPGGKMASCSSLKKSYRLAIAKAAGRPVHFIFLKGSRDVLAARIAARKNHFMPPSLLDSQLQTLEPPDANESHVVIEIDQPLDDQVKQALAFLLRP